VQKQLQVVRGINGNSPELLSALDNGTALTSGTLEIFLPGTSQVVLTYALTNAHVTLFADHTGGTDAASPTETIMIAVQTITQTAGSNAPTLSPADIAGYVTLPGGTPLPISSHDWSAARGVDPATGFVTGAPQVKTFSFTRALDLSAPTVRDAITNNAQLSPVTVELRQPGASAGYATYELLQAHVSSFTDSADGAAGHGPTQTVLLSFNQLTLTSGSSSYCLNFSSAAC
jgi:type VI protein secretion system component Hcp